MAASVFMAVVGVVSAGASECTNATLHKVYQSGGVAVDATGNVWFTDRTNNKVWMCSPSGECSFFGLEWNWPRGISVDDSGVVPVIYVSEGGDYLPHVKKCKVDRSQWGNVSCSEFGSGWISPRGLDVDEQGHVFITNACGDRHGVWKCTRSANCTLVGDSDQWPHSDHYRPQYSPDCVAADSRGTVYITGGYGVKGEANYVKKCISTGICSDFGGDWPKGGGHYNPIAVGPDDAVYICYSGTKTLIRCSADDVCENLGAFNCGSSMAIDKNGVFYVAPDSIADGGLNRVCVSPSMIDV